MSPWLSGGSSWCYRIPPLFLDLSINFLTNLSKFQLSPQDLVFLLLQSSFGLLKSCLQFFLLNLKPSALLVKLVDGTATISKLIQKILDFIGQVLVLTLDNIQLLNSFFMSSLQAEQLTVEVAAFLLAGINLSSNIISLGLPLTNNLIKVAATLLSDNGSSMNALVFHGDFFQVRLHP